MILTGGNCLSPAYGLAASTHLGSGGRSRSNPWMGGRSPVGPSMKSPCANDAMALHPGEIHQRSLTEKIPQKGEASALQVLPHQRPRGFDAFRFTRWRSTVGRSRWAQRYGAFAALKPPGCLRLLRSQRGWLPGLVPPQEGLQAEDTRAVPCAGYCDRLRICSRSGRAHAYARK